MFNYLFLTDSKYLAILSSYLNMTKQSFIHHFIMYTLFINFFIS